jgi:hypothetical protein
MARLRSWGLTLAAAAAAAGTAAAEPQSHVHRPIAQPQHSFVPPYHPATPHLPFFQLAGDAHVTATGIALTGCVGSRYSNDPGRG